MASGNAGITFETQGRCENEACADFGSEFAAYNLYFFDPTFRLRAEILGEPKEAPKPKPTIRNGASATVTSPTTVAPGASWASPRGTIPPACPPSTWRRTWRGTDRAAGIPSPGCPAPTSR